MPLSLEVYIFDISFLLTTTLHRLGHPTYERRRAAHLQRTQSIFHPRNITCISSTPHCIHAVAHRIVNNVSSLRTMGASKESIHSQGHSLNTFATVYINSTEQGLTVVAIVSSDTRPFCETLYISRSRSLSKPFPIR